MWRRLQRGWEICSSLVQHAQGSGPNLTHLSMSKSTLQSQEHSGYQTLRYRQFHWPSELVQLLAGELSSEPRSSHAESLWQKPLVPLPGTKIYFCLPRPSTWLTPYLSFPGPWLGSGCYLTGQGSLSGRESLCVPVSELLFCLCSMWGDTTGHNRKLFGAWFSKRLPLLFPLCLEDLCHPRGEGR